ncbi:hypothetical protein [Fimbriiglobus ruber]|uniref:GOLD domain-containing protein n=1 Tax=Fimbriiglobus ruber TaxID=1908690 RepID=A0A225E4I0_9BACT|nr:hypothetical protein [Fimbriiglobus ruber]OWK45708.1 hypothetical protein FRUB_02039 [Fimbriiglobus ruber]
MLLKIRLMSAAAALFAIAVFCPARADDVKPTDEGKGVEFKGKQIEMKDKGAVAILLSFPAGKEFEATTDGTKETDVHLFVYDEADKEVGKDDSTGPKCSVKVTPAKDGKYKFVIKNSKGDNTVTFKVTVAK